MSIGASTESVSLRHHTSPPKTGSSIKKQEQNLPNCKEHIHQQLSTPPGFESPSLVFLLPATTLDNSLTFLLTYKLELTPVNNLRGNSWRCNGDMYHTGDSSLQSSHFTNEGTTITIIFLFLY